MICKRLSINNLPLMTNHIWLASKVSTSNLNLDQDRKLQFELDITYDLINRYHEMSREINIEIIQYQIMICKRFTIDNLAWMNNYIGLASSFKINNLKLMNNHIGLALGIDFELEFGPDR
eukprot:Awhi_evm1s3614